MTYLVLLLPALVLPVMLAMAAFEARCSDGAPLLRRRAPGAPDLGTDVAAGLSPAPATASSDRRS